jgi:hypothetical protein
MEVEQKMSLYLGKVHFWLYNKILWFEHLEEAVYAFAAEQGYASDVWKAEFEAQFGAPSGGRPLEEIVDTGNIHGWLQDRITRAEARQAALLTRLSQQDVSIAAGLEKLFASHGVSAGKSYEGSRATPEDLFNGLNDYILDGMPCDRVNQILSNESDKFSWEMTQCVHSSVWESVGGDVNLFYALRHQWIHGFVEGVSPEFKYGFDAARTRWIERKAA